MRRIGAATGVLAVGALVTVTAALAVQPGDLATDRRASATETSQAANLALAKTVDDPTPNVGDTITFTITLSDLGPDDATSVTVNDALPAGLFFLSAMPSQGTYAPVSGLWQVGTVTTAGPQTLTLVARVDATTARTNTASISHSDQFDPDTNNNSASATETPQAANLALAKTVDDPTPNVGDTITFTVTLSDLGPDAATSVTVNDALPAGLSFLSATPSQGTYAPVSGLWQVGTLTTAGPQTLTVQARVDATTALTNTASVSHSDQFDPDTNNNSASATETPTTSAVTFASASASRSSRGVVLRWRMASEVELLGFHVYRSRRDSWRRITHSLIAAKGSVSGASYRWLDGGAKRGVLYHYRIKAVLRDGTAAWLGPLPVRSP